MESPKIISIGDAVCDKYLSRGKMYPGGQCVNTCAASHRNGVETAFIGKFGKDKVAECIQDALENMEIDTSHCRYFEGENGFACVTLENCDRVFIGSNHGGVAKQYPYDFKEEDFKYIKQFDLIYTNLNSYIEEDLPKLSKTKVPIAFDFSNRWTDEYLKKICPYIKIAILSCAHLTNDEREYEMKKVQYLGVPIVLGTIGESGSWVIYKNKFYYQKAVKTENIIDTMGAGDSYFATFLTSLLKAVDRGTIECQNEVEMAVILQNAMEAGAVFSSKMCCEEGAFGYGVPIAGRVIDNRK